MKKIFPLVCSCGLLLILIILFQSSGRAAGSTQWVLNSAEQQTEIEQAGGPWFDVHWNYRRQININNSGGLIADYQVLIHLNNSNFDFNLAKADGSDVRFTLNSGTPIDYWIEFWNNTSHEAYIWVQDPSIPSGNSSIYVYYNNPSASSASNGSNTFNLFDDDWCGFEGSGCSQSGALANIQPPSTDQNQPGFHSYINWDGTINKVWVVTGSPSVSSGILNLESANGVLSILQSDPNQAVGFRANYGLGSGKEIGGFLNDYYVQRIMIGELSTADTLYLINRVTDEITTTLGSNLHNAFHTYEVRWKNGECEADIDHGVISKTLTSATPNKQLSVTLQSYLGSNATLQVDWVYLRQYRDPEPTNSVGARQGLVNLGITLSDAPDPIAKGNNLSYLLTVSNGSGISAAGVVVTDTLPASVAYVSGTSPLGCTLIANKVVCQMDTIPANSSANATIVVKPTADASISNGAVVSSPGYDTDLSNNSAQATTLVDSVPPVVEWTEPVTNTNIYPTDGGLVTLKANAYDLSSGVNRVEFWRYIGNTPIKIKSVAAPPYSVQFDTDTLTPNQPWPFEVFAYDKANNRSSTAPNMRQVIYIERIYTNTVYLPFTTR